MNNLYFVLQDNFGDAPLHDAIEKDHPECIDVLMEAPSLDLQAQNHKGFNMLQLACLHGNVQ
jgi:ankyrin repeat protein